MSQQEAPSKLSGSSGMSDDPMEKPAKRWEVAGVITTQKAQTKQLDAIDVKIDQLLERQVTPQIVDDKIRHVDEKFEGKIKAIYTKYDPVLDNMRWLARALLGAIIAILGNIVVTLVVWGK